MRRSIVAALLLALLVLPRLAAAQAEEILYYHTDAIGSVRVVTNANGQIAAQYDYLPFGESWQPPALPETRRFTGKERDTETGFDYFDARYYASQNGRFTTVDPGHVNGDIHDPQSWNGYAYARNNPLKYNDPTGTEYEICATDAFGYSTSCGTVSDQYFAMLERNPGGGLRLWGGFIYSGNRAVGYYRQLSADPTLDSFIRQTGQLAAAELKYGTIGMGISAGLGAPAGLAGAFAGEGLVSLGSREALQVTRAGLNRLMGEAQRKLLDRWFIGKGGPEGITRRTLELYKEIIRRYPLEGKPNPEGIAVQAARLRMIEELLKRLP